MTNTIQIDNNGEKSSKEIDFEGVACLEFKNRMNILIEQNQKTFAAFDSMFEDQRVHNERVEKGRVSTCPLSGFTVYPPIRSKPVKNLEEAISRCGEALSVIKK